MNNKRKLDENEENYLNPLLLFGKLVFTFARLLCVFGEFLFLHREWEREKELLYFLLINGHFIK